MKLVPAGYRYGVGGTLNFAGSYGSYWSSTVNGGYSRDLNVGSGNAYMYNDYRAYGFSVRCLRD